MERVSSASSGQGSWLCWRARGSAEPALGVRRDQVAQALALEDYGEGFVSRQVEWGGMVGEISSFPAVADAAPLFKGLLLGRCAKRCGAS